MNPYFEQMILSASPVGLVRILYQRALSSVRDAREHLSNGRIKARGAAIGNAYAVVTELINSLRRDEAPELGDRLMGLYLYIQQRLLEANLKQTDKPLAEVLDLLTTLADAWSAVPEYGDAAPPAVQATRWSGGESMAQTPSSVALSA